MSLAVVLTTYLITNSSSLHALFVGKEFENNYYILELKSTTSVVRVVEFLRAYLPIGGCTFESCCFTSTESYDKTLRGVVDRVLFSMVGHNKEA